MKMNLRLCLLAFLCASTAAGAAPQEGLLAVQVLAEGTPDAKERRPGPVQPFYRQDLLGEAGIILQLSPEELKAFRERHGFKDNDPLELMEWLALEDGQPPRHLGYIHCVRRASYLTDAIKACFRDSDDDGRLDSVVHLQSPGLPAGGLQFEPMEPLAYTYVRSSRAPRPWSMYVQPGIGIAYRRDEATGKLSFRAQALAASLRADLEPFVEVDPAQLPATIEIAGAKIAVLAWDGKRPTIRVESPMTDRPVRVIQDDPPSPLFMRGNPKGWQFSIVGEPLPGAPR